LAPFGDHFRTRLTHTLEVSQIARTIAKALRLNEDLTEAISLGHDLGHTPFGHAGEETLAKLLPQGFYHSAQSLRIVDKLEHEGKGLNLTHEVKDGIFRHSKGRGEILNKSRQRMPATLEGQIVRVSDVIAYVNHDIDDAVRAGVIRDKDVPERLIKSLGRWPAIRIDRMVADVVRTSLSLALSRIALSGEMEDAVNQLRDFLFERVYYNPRARSELEKTEKILSDIYFHLKKNPAGYIKTFPEGDSLDLRCGDFLAGMTDLFALRLYEKLFFPLSWPLI